MPIQTFHMVASPEMRGAICFMAVSNCFSVGLNLWVKNVYAKCTLPKNKIIPADALIRIREIIVRLLGRCLKNRVAHNLSRIIAAGSHHSVWVTHLHSVNHRRQRAEHSPLASTEPVLFEHSNHGGRVVQLVCEGC